MSANNEPEPMVRVVFPQPDQPPGIYEVVEYAAFSAEPEGIVNVVARREAAHTVLAHLEQVVGSSPIEFLLGYVPVQEERSPEEANDLKEWDRVRHGLVALGRQPGQQDLFPGPGQPLVRMDRAWTLELLRLVREASRLIGPRLQSGQHGRAAPPT
jgi:hypothetical protein